MKYKVGDRVIHRHDPDKILTMDTYNGVTGKILEIYDDPDQCYKVLFDNGIWFYVDEKCLELITQKRKYNV